MFYHILIVPPSLLSSFNPVYTSINIPFIQRSIVKPSSVLALFPVRTLTDIKLYTKTFYNSLRLMTVYISLKCFSSMIIPSIIIS